MTNPEKPAGLESGAAHRERFLRALAAVCREFQLSLGHEDKHGAFEIHPYRDEYITWLLDASDRTGEP